MADQQLLDLLKQGRTAWNAWRESNRDHFPVDLSHADLSNEDLSGARLFGVDLTDANLTTADLSNANLVEANLSHAALVSATLIGADLDASCRGQPSRSFVASSAPWKARHG